jgi:hypothetical protein
MASCRSHAPRSRRRGAQAAREQFGTPPWQAMSRGVRPALASAAFTSAPRSMSSWTIW